MALSECSSNVISHILPDWILESFVSGVSDVVGNQPSHLSETPVVHSSVEFPAPHLSCVNARVSGTRKRSAWNWRVCIQSEEIEDAMEYNVTCHKILLIHLILL